MPQVECLHFIDVDIEPPNFYDNKLTMSPILKKLSVRLGQRLESYDRGWLHQVHPNLTQIQCSQMPPLDDLNIFFEQNPKVLRSFSVSILDITRYNNGYNE